MLVILPSFPGACAAPEDDVRMRISRLPARDDMTDTAADTGDSAADTDAGRPLPNPP